MVQDGH